MRYRLLCIDKITKVVLVNAKSATMEPLSLVALQFPQCERILEDIEHPDQPKLAILRGHPLDALCKRVHVANEKWWTDLETGVPKDRNIGELLMTVVSEIAEAMEGHRKGLMDDKLTNRKMFDVELVDAIIRIFDVAAVLCPEFGEIFEEKMAFNAVREDHKVENRKKEGGKKY